jgi:hypothetical protein
VPGNRCESCQRFVSLEQGEPEVEGLEVDAAGEVVTGSVRLSLICADCGQELKEAQVDLSIAIEGLAEHASACAESGQAEVEVDDISPEDRLMDRDRKGRKITRARFMKHLWGARVVVTVTCGCGETWEAEGLVEESASGFDEL